MIRIRGEVKHIHRHLLMALLGLAFVLHGVPAWSMTLTEAVDLAVRTYPDVRAAEEYGKALEQRLRKEFAGYLPTIDFSAGYGREISDNATTRVNRNAHDSVLSRGETGLTFNQMVFDGDDVRHKVAQAEALLRAAMASLNKTSDDTALRAVQAYVDVVIKHAQLELIKDNVLLHQRILAKVRKKFEGGAGNQADVHQAESRTFLASAGHASNQLAYQTALAKFTEIIGQAPPPEGMIQPDAPETLLPASLEEALEIALRDNPELAGARLNLEASEADLQVKRANFWPKVNMELGATNNANVGGSEGHSKSVSAMLRMRYNLYQGGAHLADVRGARNQLERIQQVLDRVQRTVVERVQETWSKLNMTRDRVSFLRKHVAVSRRVTSSYHDQFKMGKRTLLDVLNSENELFSAKNSLLFEELTYIKTSYEMLAYLGALRGVFIIPEETTPSSELSMDGAVGAEGALSVGDDASAVESLDGAELVGEGEFLEGDSVCRYLPLLCSPSFLGDGAESSESGEVSDPVVTDEVSEPVVTDEAVTEEGESQEGKGLCHYLPMFCRGASSEDGAASEEETSSEPEGGSFFPLGDLFSPSASEDAASPPEGEVPADPKGDVFSPPEGDAPASPKGDVFSPPEGDAPASPKGDVFSPPEGATPASPKGGVFMEDGASLMVPSDDVVVNLSLLQELLGETAVVVGGEKPPS